MTKKNTFLRISLLLTLLLLVAAVAVGCGETIETEESTVETTTVVETAESESPEKIGEGEYTFEFTAVFEDGTSKVYEVSTDAENIADALYDLKLIDGEESQYGFTVYTVCGVTHDFNSGNVYWKLCVDGEDSFVGASSVKCSDVKKVEFRAEKF